MVYTRRAQFLRYLAWYLANVLRFVCVAWGLVSRLKKLTKDKISAVCAAHNGVYGKSGQVQTLAGDDSRYRPLSTQAVLKRKHRFEVRVAT